MAEMKKERAAQKHEEIMNALDGVCMAKDRLNDLRYRISQNHSPPNEASENVETEWTLESVLDRLPKDLVQIKEEIDGIINDITASLF